MDMNSEDIRMENIRLNEAVIRLERENEYLRMLIDKLMPQHVNAEIADYFIAPVEGEVENVSQNDVHNHDESHGQNQNA